MITRLQIKNSIAGDFDIQLPDGKLILVGDHGSGKTAVLNVLASFLRGHPIQTALSVIAYDGVFLLDRGPRYSHVYINGSTQSSLFIRQADTVESEIELFLKLCSNYFDTVEPNIHGHYIYPLFDKKPFDELSCGQQRIVTILKEVCFGHKNQVVLLDNPETYLSVTYQRVLLQDIVDSGKCSTLVVATHSPFIYDNNLRPYAHSIEEFRIK